jgi:hypothetical protein
MIAPSQQSGRELLKMIEALEKRVKDLEDKTGGLQAYARELDERTFDQIKLGKSQ